MSSSSADKPTFLFKRLAPNELLRRSEFDTPTCALLSTSITNSLRLTLSLHLSTFVVPSLSNRLASLPPQPRFIGDPSHRSHRLSRLTDALEVSNCSRCCPTLEFFSLPTYLNSTFTPIPNCLPVIVISLSLSSPNPLLCCIT
jgi:hypothetical protein